MLAAKANSPTIGAPGRSQRGIRTSLLLLLAAVLLVAGLRWWQLNQRSHWLETASLEELAAAAARNEQDVAVFERLGARAREAEQWGRAAKAFQHAVELAPDRVGNWVGWSRSIYEIDGFRSAELILNEYLRLHPGDGKGYLERAGLRRAAQRRDTALEDAIKATELLPNSGEAWALRGDLSLDEGLDGEAEAAYRKAQERMPDSPWPHVGLFQISIQLQKMPEALAAAELIAQRFPSLPEAPLYMAEAKIENAAGPEDYDAARRFLEEARKKVDRFRPLDQFALEFLTGRSYFNQKRWSEALPYLERAYEKVPDHPDMLFQLGRTYRALGKTEKAKEILEKHRQAYENIGVVRRLTAQIRDNPANPAPRLELARWYARKGAMTSASVQYEEMISRNLNAETARKELSYLEEHGKLP